MKEYSLFELENTALRELNLGNNQITDAGAIALSKNITLRQLNSPGNQITNAGPLLYPRIPH
jgi:Leucine-rich repeat (LRR) protein